MHFTIRPDLDQRNGEAAELNQSTVADEQRDNQAVNRSRRSRVFRGQSLLAAARFPPSLAEGPSDWRNVDAARTRLQRPRGASLSFPVFAGTNGRLREC